MAREGAGASGAGGSKVPQPILEVLKDCHQTVTSVGTSAEPIPATNLSGRRAMFIQNLSATDVYIGSCRPDLLAWKAGLDKTISATRKYLKWTLSTGGGTTEYYAEKISQGGDPSLTEPLIVYGIIAADGAETLLVNGTAGALNNLEWDWGDVDSLGYNTVYIRLNVSDPDSLADFTLISYTTVPDTSSSYGIHLGQYDSIFCTWDGSVRVFACASGTSNVMTLEV